MANDATIRPFVLQFSADHHPVMDDDGQAFGVQAPPDRNRIKLAGAKEFVLPRPFPGPSSERLVRGLLSRLGVLYPSSPEQRRSDLALPPELQAILENKELSAADRWRVAMTWMATHPSPLLRGRVETSVGRFHEGVRLPSSMWDDAVRAFVVTIPDSFTSYIYEPLTKSGRHAYSHGGILLGVLSQIATAENGGEPYPTVDVSYLRPVPVGVPLSVYVEHRGDQTILQVEEIFQNDGRRVRYIEAGFTDLSSPRPALGIPPRSLRADQPMVGFTHDVVTSLGGLGVTYALQEGGRLLFTRLDPPRSGGFDPKTLWSLLEAIVDDAAGLSLIQYGKVGVTTELALSIVDREIALDRPVYAVFRVTEPAQWSDQTSVVVEADVLSEDGTVHAVATISYQVSRLAKRILKSEFIAALAPQGGETGLPIDLRHVATVRALQQLWGPEAFEKFMQAIERLESKKEAQVQKDSSKPFAGPFSALKRMMREGLAERGQLTRLFDHYFRIPTRYLYDPDQLREFVARQLGMNPRMLERLVAEYRDAHLDWPKGAETLFLLGLLLNPARLIDRAWTQFMEALMGIYADDVTGLIAAVRLFLLSRSPRHAHEGQRQATVMAVAASKAVSVVGSLGSLKKQTGLFLPSLTSRQILSPSSKDNMVEYVLPDGQSLRFILNYEPETGRYVPRPYVYLHSNKAGASQSTRSTRLELTMGAHRGEPRAVHFEIPGYGQAELVTEQVQGKALPLFRLLGASEGSDSHKLTAAADGRRETRVDGNLALRLDPLAEPVKESVQTLRPSSLEIGMDHYLPGEEYPRSLSSEEEALLRGVSLATSPSPPTSLLDPFGLGPLTVLGGIAPIFGPATAANMVVLSR